MTKEQIHIICEKYGITNYTINDDISIDVDGDVNLYNKQLDKLPLIFGKVFGDFDCSRNRLTSLKGSPVELYGNFYCSGNHLTTLKNGYTKVSGNFHCHNNQLATLEGGPKFIGGGLYCRGNPIYEEFRTKFNEDYDLYQKYIHRQKVLKGILND